MCMFLVQIINIDTMIILSDLLIDQTPGRSSVQRKSRVRHALQGARVLWSSIQIKLYAATNYTLPYQRYRV